MLREMLQFVRGDSDCFARSNQAGHITGSAWVVDPAREHVLLLHHAKLDRWLQPGGHLEDDADVLAGALREAREESGLTTLCAVSPAIFDVDIHWIPARDTMPRHRHYDVRFLLAAERREEPQCSHESKEAVWVPLSRLTTFNTANSIARMAAKTAKMLQ